MSSLISWAGRPALCEQAGASAVENVVLHFVTALNKYISWIILGRLATIMAWLQRESDSVAASEYLKSPLTVDCPRCEKTRGGGSTYRGTPLSGVGEIDLVSLPLLKKNKKVKTVQKERYDLVRDDWGVGGTRGCHRILSTG